MIFNDNFSSDGLSIKPMELSPGSEITADSQKTNCFEAYLDSEKEITAVNQNFDSDKVQGPAEKSVISPPKEIKYMQTEAEKLYCIVNSKYKYSAEAVTRLAELKKNYGDVKLKTYNNKTVEEILSGRSVEKLLAPEPDGHLNLSPLSKISLFESLIFASSSQNSNTPVDEPKILSADQSKDNLFSIDSSTEPSNNLMGMLSVLFDANLSTDNQKLSGNNDASVLISTQQFDQSEATQREKLTDVEILSYAEQSFLTEQQILQFYDFIKSDDSIWQVVQDIGVKDFFNNIEQIDFSGLTVLRHSLNAMAKLDEEEAGEIIDLSNHIGKVADTDYEKLFVYEQSHQGVLSAVASIKSFATNITSTLMNKKNVLISSDAISNQSILENVIKAQISAQDFERSTHIISDGVSKNKDWNEIDAELEQLTLDTDKFSDGHLQVSYNSLGLDEQIMEVSSSYLPQVSPNSDEDDRKKSDSKNAKDLKEQSALHPR